MLVPDADYVIRFVSLPSNVNGFVAYDEDARANIYINENINDDQKLETIRHELRHVLKDDVTVEKDIRCVEG